MRRTIGRLLLGFACGFMLSRLRAMPGGDAVDWVGVDGTTAMAWRAAGLGLVALSWFGVAGGGTWSFLAAISAGFAAHGFAFGPTHGLPWVMLLLMPVVLIASWSLIAPGRDEPPGHGSGSGHAGGSSAAAHGDFEGAHPANLGERIGLFVAGVGTAIGVEAIARHVRLLGLGLAQDDTVFGAVFLALVAFGAAAFGWMVSARATRRLSFPVALAAAGAACFVSLAFVDVVADGKGLRPMIDRWNLRPIEVGTLSWDALFSAAAFVVPALLIGAGLAGARGRRSASFAILGAAVGLLAVPRMLDPGRESGGEAAEFFSAQLVPIASLITLAGAALAVLSESKRRPRARYVALLAIALCGIPALTRTTKPVIMLSPWEGRLIMPFVAFERGTGLATVEPSRQGLKIATLNRRELTPDVDGIASDHQRIADSFALLEPGRTKVRVLFVGVMTPLRAAALSLHDVARVDRTAAWWTSMPRLEKALFEDMDGNAALTPPEGEIISPEVARERIAKGDYDLVIAPPGGGDAPGIGAQDAPESTTVARWIGLDAPLRGVVNPRTTQLRGSTVEHAVVLSADGLEQLSFGIVTHGAQAPAVDARRVRVLEFERDPRAEAPWTHLRRILTLRIDAARRSTFAALAASDPSALAAALAKFHALQAASPPFERGLTRFELDTDTLADFQRAASEAPLDPFVRSTWSWLARVLIEKRDVANIDRFLPALATAHAPWSELEIALAYGDLEGLEPAAAARRLEAVVGRESSNWRAWFALGEARELNGDLAGAAKAFEAVCTFLPDATAPRRRLAMALTRVDPEAGHKLVVELLTKDPQDEELQAYLGPEPPPPPPKAYTPAKLH